MSETIEWEGWNYLRNGDDWGKLYAETPCNYDVNEYPQSPIDLQYRKRADAFEGKTYGWKAKGKRYDFKSRFHNLSPEILDEENKLNVLWYGEHTTLLNMADLKYKIDTLAATNGETYRSTLENELAGQVFGFDGTFSLQDI